MHTTKSTFEDFLTSQLENCSFKIVCPIGIYNFFAKVLKMEQNQTRIEQVSKGTSNFHILVC